MKTPPNFAISRRRDSTTTMSHLGAAVDALRATGALASGNPTLLAWVRASADLADEAGWPELADAWRTLLA